MNGRIAAGAALFIIGCGEDNMQIVAPPDSFRLVWSEEFEGAAGARVDEQTWSYDIGIGPNGDGWGNNELQFYTDQADNVALDGMGNLAITAREEDFGGRSYTSARIQTQNKVFQQYGRIEARIKLPVGRGIWPAFWMLGNDFGFGEGQVPWPQTGEIDIMEYRGQEPRVVLGTIHGPGYSGGESIGRRFRTTEEEGFDADFHVYAVEWDPARIVWYVDDVAYSIITAGEVTARGEWVFTRPFFLLLNVAVGGSFVGPVGGDTEFPQTMLVDYVRVYDRNR